MFSQGRVSDEQTHILLLASHQDLSLSVVPNNGLRIPALFRKDSGSNLDNRISVFKHTS